MRTLSLLIFLSLSFIATCLAADDINSITVEKDYHDWSQITARDGNYIFMSSLGNYISVCEYFNPKEINFIKSIKLDAPLNSIVASDGKLYAATADSGLWILDVSDLRQVKTIYEGKTGKLLDSLRINSGRLYGFYRNTPASVGLMAIDISNENSPKILGTFDSLKGTTYKVFIGNCLYDLKEKIIYDISDFKSVKNIGKFPGAAINANYSMIRGNYLWLFKSVMQNFHDPDTAFVYDIKDPVNPRLCRTLNCTVGMMMAYDDKTLVFADGMNESFSAYEIKDDTTIVEIRDQFDYSFSSGERDYNEIYGINLFDGYIVALANLPKSYVNALAVYDIGSDTIEMVQPANVFFNGADMFAGPDGMLYGGTLYGANRHSIFNMSSPSLNSTSYRHIYTTEVTIDDFAVKYNFVLYSGKKAVNKKTFSCFYIYDVNDISKPARMLEQLTDSANCPKISFTLDDKFLYYYFFGSIYIYTAQNLKYIQPANLVDFTHQVLQMKKSGNYLYLNCGADGLYVLDASNPKNINVPSQPALNDNIQNIQISGDKLFVAKDNIITIYDITKGDKPEYLSELNMGGNIRDYLIADDYIFSVAGDLVIASIKDIHKPEITKRYEPENYDSFLALGRVDDRIILTGTDFNKVRFTYFLDRYFATSAEDGSEINQLVSASVFPNPSDGFINIIIDDSQIRGNIRPEIYDSRGNAVSVLNSNDIQVEDNIIHLNTRSLGSGIYYIKLSNGESSRMYRFVVAR